MSRCSSATEICKCKQAVGGLRGLCDVMIRVVLKVGQVHTNYPLLSIISVPSAVSVDDATEQMVNNVHF